MSATRRPKRGRRIMDPAEREAFKQSRQDEQRESIANAVSELASSDGWRKWCESRSKFHQYSLNNTLLIAMQRPDATQVASYRTWQELNRQVNRGEHGIRIMAPIRKKVEDPETGEKHESVVFFKAVSVFDVTQTTGEDLPELPVEPITGESHADRLPALEAFAASIGASVEYRDLSEHPAGGWHDPQSGEIVVDSSTCANAKVRTLVHEIAHALGVGYKQYGRADAEVIVESVTIIVLGSLGLDTSGESIPYVANWGDGDTEALRKYAATVDEIARKLEALNT